MSALGQALPLALGAAFYPPALLVLLLLLTGRHPRRLVLTSRQNAALAGGSSRRRANVRLHPRSGPLRRRTRRSLQRFASHVMIAPIATTPRNATTHFADFSACGFTAA